MSLLLRAGFVGTEPVRQAVHRQSPRQGPISSAEAPGLPQAKEPTVPDSGTGSNAPTSEQASPGQVPRQLLTEPAEAEMLGELSDLAFTTRRGDGS